VVWRGNSQPAFPLLPRSTAPAHAMDTRTLPTAVAASSSTLPAQPSPPTATAAGAGATDELAAVKLQIGKCEQKIAKAEEAGAAWDHPGLIVLQQQLAALQEKENLLLKALHSSAAVAASASAPPPDTHTLFTILEDLPQRMLELVNVAVASPKHTVAVRGWSGQPTLYVTAATYGELEAQLCSAWAARSAAAAAAATGAGASSLAAPAPSPTLHPSSFTLYYVPPSFPSDAPFSDWYHVRHTSKVASDAELQGYLLSFPAHARPPLLLWQPPAALAAALSADPSVRMAYTKVSPTKEQAPVPCALQSPPLPRPPSDAGSTASARSSTSSSRDSSVQADFASGVRMRDGAQCIVCSDAGVMSVELQAAHVVPLSGPRAEQWQAAGLSSPNDTRNGVVLCVSCHWFFDRGLWCIDPVDRRSMLVTQALAQRRPEWHTRNGQHVRCTTPFHPDWPTQQTLQIQFAFMQNQTAERHAEQAAKKFECPYCGRRYASGTSVYFTRHVRTHAVANEPLGQWTVFHTPAKKR